MRVNTYAGECAGTIESEAQRWDITGEATITAQKLDSDRELATSAHQIVRVAVWTHQMARAKRGCTSSADMDAQEIIHTAERIAELAGAALDGEAGEEDITLPRAFDAPVQLGEELRELAAQMANTEEDIDGALADELETMLEKIADEIESEHIAVCNGLEDIEGLKQKNSPRAVRHIRGPQEWAGIFVNGSGEEDGVSAQDLRDAEEWAKSLEPWTIVGCEGATDERGAILYVLFREDGC